MKPASRRSTWLLLAVSIPTLILLLILGTWQVERLQWKEALLDRIAERVAAEPVPLADIAGAYEAGADIEYRPVTLSGRLMNDREQHYLATWQGQSGFFVHTPMALADGRSIFVNRGFVPYDRKDAETRAAGQTEGVVQIGGLARIAPEEKPSFLVPDNAPDQNIFYWKDLDAMVASARLTPEAVYPFYVDADEAPNPGGLPVGGVTRIDLPNSHLQYAVTWYGLAFALVIVLGFWFLRRNDHNA
ncbi:SURF1 family protein [Nitratireductor luteus]|uniref:SURF1 family protein n=1 Tax=Nitratireductor luteus TaxID=2976980 RepID=UPI002240C1AE|nr:SURF1 family protein [Nitratireductor luteus]